MDKEAAYAYLSQSGSTGGGTTVTITGTNLSGATAVHFGAEPANITANTATSVTVVSPSGAGTVPVTVTYLAPASRDGLGYSGLRASSRNRCGHSARS
ncbi:IPT/TIG domain-containing protein [Nocardia gipuzkoensis]